jgi:hypothetical protein
MKQEPLWQVRNWAGEYARLEPDHLNCCVRKLWKSHLTGTITYQHATVPEACIVHARHWQSCLAVGSRCKRFPSFCEEGIHREILEGLVFTDMDLEIALNGLITV